MTNLKKRKIHGSSHASPEDRRAELLQAAMATFGKHGYYSTTIDAIAQEAGLSKGSVYRFFKTKDHILLAILDQYESDITAIIERKLSSSQSVVEGIEVAFKAGLIYVAERKELLSVWMEFYRHPDAMVRIRKMFSDSRAEYTAAFKQAIANGEIPKQPIDPIVNTLMAINEGFLILTEVEESFDFEMHINGVWNVMHQGLLHPPKKGK